MFWRWLGSVLVLLLAISMAQPHEAVGQQADEAAEEEADTELGPWQVGLQSSWPAHGIGAMYRRSEDVSLQGVFGGSGRWLNLGGRLLYRFTHEDSYDLYGYGAAGAWQWRGRNGSSEWALSGGAGGGVELDWRSIVDDSDFIPLYSTLDLGLSLPLSSFTYTSLTAITVGVGIHYRF